jgi:hypothetical protein
MTTKDLVTALSQEVQKNPVFKDFALLCASRHRARKDLTVVSVSRNMKAQGFDHSDDKIISVLKLLADLGVGKIDKDHKGRIRALKDIRIKLQSLGAAALGEVKDELKGFRPRTNFGTLPQPTPPKAAPEVRAARSPRPWQTSGARIVLTVLLGDKPINIPVPANLTALEIAALVEKFSKGE